MNSSLNIDSNAPYMRCTDTFLNLQSHYSYSNCGLGSKGTDRLVTLVRQAMLDPKRDVATLFGAKITGGGCGGTVCILGRAGNKSRDKILEVSPLVLSNLVSFDKM